MSESFVQGSSNPNSVTPIGVQKDMKCLFGANIKKGNFLSGRVQLSHSLAYGTDSYNKFYLVSRNLNILFIVESYESNSSYGSLYLDAYDLSTLEFLYSTTLEGRHIAYHQSKDLIATAGGRNKSRSYTYYHIYTATRTGLSLLYSGNDGLGGDGQYTNVCLTDNFLVFNGHNSSYSMTAVNLSTGAKTTTRNSSVYMHHCRMVYAGNEYILAVNSDSEYDSSSNTRVHLLKLDSSGNITYPVNNVKEPVGYNSNGFFLWCSEWGKAVYGKPGSIYIDAISFTESSITCNEIQVGSASSSGQYSYNPSYYTFYQGGVSYVDFPEVSSIDVISTSGTHLVSIYSDGSYTQTPLATNDIYLCGMNIMPVGLKTDGSYPVVFSLSRVTVGEGSNISLQDASFDDTFKAVSHS